MTYQLSDPNFRERFEYHLDNPIVSAEQEIAILGSMIEESLNSAKTPAEKAAARRDVETWLIQRANLRTKVAAMKIAANEVFTKATVQNFLRGVAKLFADSRPEVGNPHYDFYCELIKTLAPRIGELADNMENPKE